MSDAQVWSIIGVLAATLGTMVVGMFTLFSRTLKAEFNSVRSEFRGEFNSVRSEFRGEFNSVRSEITGLRGEMEARFDAADARFDAVNTRIDTLDRDVQTVFNHLFGSDRGKL